MPRPSCVRHDSVLHIAAELLVHYSIMTPANDSTAFRMRSLYALHRSLTVTITAIQPRLRLSGTNRLGFQPSMAINTYPRPDGWQRWQSAVDIAADLSVDALICADIGVLEYAHNHWPNLPLHLSVQASSTNYEALQFYYDNFGIRRAVLPRVLSLSQVKHVIENTPVEIEVFGFGSLCVMVEGRCILSSYVTGQSPNTHGACSPAEFVEYRETSTGLESRLGGLLTDRYATGEQAGYPTICKGRFAVGDDTFYAIEEPTSLNTLALLPQLRQAGIRAIKIEGQQRSPAYVGMVAKVWREAIDCSLADPDGFTPKAEWNQALNQVSEGATTTLGPYYRPWQ